MPHASSRQVRESLQQGVIIHLDYKVSIEWFTKIPDKILGGGIGSDPIGPAPSLLPWPESDLHLTCLLDSIPASPLQWMVSMVTAALCKGGRQGWVGGGLVWAKPTEWWKLAAGATSKPCPSGSGRNLTGEGCGMCVGE